MSNVPDNKHGGKRQGAGRPRSNSPLLREMRQLAEATEATVEAFKTEVRIGFVRGVSRVAESFPYVVEGLIRKAVPVDPKTGDLVPEAGDTDVQKFLADKFMRFFQPEIMLKTDGQTPMQNFLESLRTEIKVLEEAHDPQTITVEAVVIEEGA